MTPPKPEPQEPKPPAASIPPPSPPSQQPTTTTTSTTSTTRTTEPGTRPPSEHKFAVFEYRTIDVNLVAPMFGRRVHPDAYLTDDADVVAVRSWLELGFRWVRTDGAFAVFERERPT